MMPCSGVSLTRPSKTVCKAREAFAAGTISELRETIDKAISEVRK